MIDTPAIVTTTPQHYASIELQIPLAEIGSVMGPTHSAILAAIKAQGLEQAGPWFTHHFRRPTNVFDFEVCVPTAQPMQTEGRVLGKEWPAMQVVRTIYHGNYTELAHSWGEVEAWIKAQGIAVREEFWEVYLTHPGANPDPASWQTQLNWVMA